MKKATKKLVKKSKPAALKITKEKTSQPPKKTLIKNAISLLLSVLMCLLTGLIGSVFTIKEVSTWYVGLAKPDFSPPGWVFAPVWTALYVMMGISFYFIWLNRKNDRLSKSAVILFLAHLIVNVMWSAIFFGMHNPLSALFVICLLWSMIVTLIFSFYRINKTASMLLVPYLLWVSFATLLNYAIVILN